MMAPPSSPVVVAHALFGIMVSICVTLRMGTPPFQKFYSIKVMDIFQHSVCGSDGSTTTRLHLPSPPLSISPQSQEDTALVLDEDDLEDKDMVPTTCNTGYATTQPVSHPLDEVKWYEPPPPPPEILPRPPLITTPPISLPEKLFKLGMSMVFSDDASCSETVVYEGVMPDSLTHTVW